MIYSYGCRVDNDSNAITVIDEENRTAETKGYVNGEYVEFSGGGGGGDLKNKTLTMTVINNTSEGAGNIYMFLDNNGMIENNSVDLPAANETEEYAALIVPSLSLDQDEYSASQMFPVPPSTTAIASNENNCTFNNEMFGANIIITDYTQDASITITLSDS